MQVAWDVLRQRLSAGSRRGSAGGTSIIDRMRAVDVDKLDAPALKRLSPTFKALVEAGMTAESMKKTSVCAEHFFRWLATTLEVYRLSTRVSSRGSDVAVMPLGCRVRLTEWAGRARLAVAARGQRR